eukprot:scaffold5603_cov125-Isochrysis_galbana.AAC.2
MDLWNRVHATVGSGAGAGRQGARPPRSQVSRRILKYDKGTHNQTQAHRGIINQGNPAVMGRESGGGPGDGGVGHLLAGPYSGELSVTQTPPLAIKATQIRYQKGCRGGGGRQAP